MTRLETALWGRASVGQLLGVMARAAGADAGAGDPAPAPKDDSRLPGWMEAAASTFGMETEAVEVWGFRAEYLLRTSAPALVPVAGGWAGLLDVRRGWAWLLAPDLSRKAVPLADLVRALCAQPAEPFQAGIAKLVGECGIVPRRRQRAIEALAREKLRYTLVTTVWPLRTAPGASFRRQLSDAGVLRKAALLAVAHGVEYLLWIGAWYILGRDTLAGRLDPGWLAAWGLALATIVPCRLLTTWLQGAVAISGGGLLRQRLLDGALRLTSEEVRHEGAGRFLGRVIETELIESLALSGGMLPVLATLELCFSAAVLLAGAAPASHALALALAAGAAVTLAWRYFRRRADWTAARLAMTHDLVERMTGYRTRLAQEPPGEWHPPEDRAVAQCLELAAAMDRENARLTGALPRAWLLAGIAALTPAFLGARPDTAAMAVSLGGLLLAWQAFRRLAAGLANLAGAAISWRQVAPLFDASARGRDERAPAAETSSTGDTVVDAKDLAFAYHGRATRVLDGVDLRIRRGEWVLLEGESGGGKSTLVSVLAGLREADSGLLLTGGLDRATLGTRRWRQRIAAAPQFQENHVLSAPFAFNLLMGRRWPASEDDLAEAAAVCRDLGLGPLLERMPGGLMQMVGETGWQLSQGERSRLFIARALLQRPELVVLDESFGALDPETLRQSLECVLKRAETLLVVAHP